MRRSFMLLALLSSSTFAAVDGTSVNWSDYKDMVNNNCTGTLIGGKFILTAAHCYDIKNTVITQDGAWINPTVVNDHLNYPGVEGYDLSVLTLPNRLETTYIHYFADLNSDPVRNGDEVRLFGFAGTQDQLSYATMTVDTTPTVVTSRYTAEKTIGGGETQGGDSGGAWLNSSNDIVGVHNASDIAGGATDYTFGINLHDSKDFILDTIDGWHYPTLATANGAKTITVQSLHTGGSVDSAYSDGNVTITGGTCKNGAIGEFEKCTYEIEATGEGKLWLTPTEYIHVNKPAPGTDNGGGSSGGSMSIFSMFALLGLGFARNRGCKREAAKIL